MKLELWANQPGNYQKLLERIPHVGEKHSRVYEAGVEQAYYEWLLDNGWDDGMARMFIQGPPSLKNTDGAFFEGGDSASGIGMFAGGVRGDQVASLYEHRAKQAGVNTNGKRYISQLAEYVGDPNAWVSSRGEADAKGEIVARRRAEKRIQKENGPKRLGADIVRAEMQKEFAKNPEANPMDVEERVRQRHSGGIYDCTPVLTKPKRKRK